MSSLHITHPHTRPPAEARAAVDEMGRELHRRFGAETRWEGDVLHVERSGARGTVTVAPEAVEVEMRLSGPFALAKGMVAAQVRQELAQRL